VTPPTRYIVRVLPIVLWYPLANGGTNGVADDSGGQMYEEPETSSMHDGHQLATSPGAHPISGRPPTFPAGVTAPSSSEGAFYPGPVQRPSHNSHSTLHDLPRRFVGCARLTLLTVPGPYTGSTSSHSHSSSTNPNTAHAGPHPAFLVPLGQECQAVRQPSPSHYLPEQNIPYPQSHSGVSGADQFQAAYQIDRTWVPYPAVSPLSKRWCGRNSRRFGWPDLLRGTRSLRNAR
jgi:hypothetical protein